MRSNLYPSYNHRVPCSAYNPACSSFWSYQQFRVPFYRWYHVECFFHGQYPLGQEQHFIETVEAKKFGYAPDLHPKDLKRIVKMIGKAEI
jgi:hypothetical protein